MVICTRAVNNQEIAGGSGELHSLRIGVAGFLFPLATTRARYDFFAHRRKGSPMSVERRRSTRIPFAASAEIIDEAENIRSATQVSDLSLNGCFVQLANPFPEGTSVTIEIYRDEDFVETPATVAYFLAKRGMDLTFTDMEPQFASILKRWLAQTKTPTRMA